MYRTESELELLSREIEKTEKAERKLLKRTSRKSENLVTGKVKEKIPEKAMSSMEAAFEKGFTLLFTKGDGLIDKMGIQKARRMYEIYAASLEKMVYEETIKAVDKEAGSRTLMTKGTSTVEGTAMGAFGLGMPDIPVFLAMLLKTVYEIAAGYGFDYRDPEEKRYTLALLNTVFSRGEEQLEYSETCDRMGLSIDDGYGIDPTITEDDIREVSNILATDLLVAKFVQGFTFIGVIGGPINLAMIHKVSRLAKLKYRKRFLYRLMDDE